MARPRYLRRVRSLRVESVRTPEDDYCRGANFMALMTTAQLAHELGTSEDKVRELIAAGALHAEKLAGVWAVSYAAIQALRRRQPGARRRDDRDLLED